MAVSWFSKIPETPEEGQEDRVMDWKIQLIDNQGRQSNRKQDQRTIFRGLGAGRQLP